LASFCWEGESRRGKKEKEVFQGTSDDNNHPLEGKEKGKKRSNYKAKKGIESIHGRARNGGKLKRGVDAGPSHGGPGGKPTSEKRERKLGPPNLSGNGYPGPGKKKY